LLNNVETLFNAWSPSLYYICRHS